MAKMPKLIVKGDKELIRKLKRLGDRRKLRKVLRQATNAAAQVVVKEVRRKYPKDTGFTAKSVTKKIIRTRGGYTGIIGTDKDARSEESGHLIVPSHIDHLIEFGWQTPEGTTVPAVAPLRKGFDAAKPAADAKFAAKAKQAIEKEAMRK